MNKLARISFAAAAFAAANIAIANDRVEVVCKPEIVDAASGQQAVVCRIRTTGSDGKEITIENPSIQGDVGSIGVAL